MPAPTTQRRNSVSAGAPPPLHLPPEALSAPPPMAPVGGQGSLPSASGPVVPPATLPAAALTPQFPAPGGQTGAGQRQRTVQPSAALLAAQRARKSAAQAGNSTVDIPPPPGPPPAQTGNSTVDIPPPSTPPPAQTGSGTVDIPPPNTPPPVNQPVGPPNTPPPPQTGGTTGNNPQQPGPPPQQTGGTTGNNPQQPGPPPPQTGGTTGNNPQQAGPPPTQTGGTTGNNPPPPPQTAAPQTPATVSLNDQQKFLLSGIKRTLVGRKCEEIGRTLTGTQLSGSWKLAPEARNNPSYTPTQPPQTQGQTPAQSAQPPSRRRRVANWFRRVGKKGMDWGKDSVVDVGTPGLDIASSAVDYAGGGSERSWLHVANQNPNEAQAWGDGELQSEGIPIAGAVIKSIDCIVQAVKLGIKIKDYIGEHREGGHTSAERGEMFMNVVDNIQNLLDTAMAWAGSFTTALGQLPIVGAIIGAVNAGIGLVEDAIRLSKADRYIGLMRKQKAAAKTVIKTKQGALGVQVGAEEDRTTGRGSHRQTMKKFKVKRDYQSVRDAGAKRDRTTRLDEKTKQLRSGMGSTSASPASGGTAPAASAPGGAASEEKEAAIRALEDYDVTKEITQANENRRREGITKIILKDIVGFGTALAAIDPTGLGSAIGASVTAAINAGFLAQKAAGAIRQKMRETGAFGTDQNKSNANKRARRHNLAVVMYDRIAELAETKVASIGDQASVPAETAGKLNADTKDTFQRMDERIKAMGVAGPFLRSKDALEMVKAMRKGFYRDT